MKRAERVGKRSEGKNQALEERGMVLTIEAGAQGVEAKDAHTETTTNERRTGK